MAGLYDWGSLIPDAFALGGKIVGDKLAPSPDLQSVQNTEKQNAFNNQITLAKMGNANALRSFALPGMFTTLGYSPEQGQSMAQNYSAQAAKMPASQGYGGAYSGGGGGGLGSKIGKTALGVGMNFAPKILGGLLHAGSQTAALNAAGWTADGLAGGVGGTGLGGTIAGLATNPFTIAGAAALAAGLIWKKTQAHPTADKWVQGEQNPFDEHMKMLNQQGLPPDQLKQAKMQSAQQYLTALNQFSQGGGHNMEVARNAAATFRQYYGEPALYGIRLQF